MSKELRAAALSALDFLEFGGRRHDRIFVIESLKEALNEHDPIDCNNCIFLGKKGNCTADTVCGEGGAFIKRDIVQLYNELRSKSDSV